MLLYPATIKRDGSSFTLIFPDVPGAHTNGVRKAELARRMGVHKQQVERLFDIGHSPRIEQLEAAFAALQMRLVPDVQRAGKAA